MCQTQLDTVRIQYHWIDNSYSSSSNREIRRKCSGIIIIRMVPIGQNIIRRTYNTDMTSSRMVVTLLPSVPT